MEYLLAFLTGAATLAACLFFILRNQKVKDTRAKNTIKTDADRKRIEANIASHGEEVRRIMEKINRYKNAVIILFFPIAAFGQIEPPRHIPIPELNYKDVMAINKKGLLFNYADSIVVINPERHRFYEGLMLDIVNLNAHYEAVVAGKDSIIELTAGQLRESDDLLNQCAADLEALRKDDGGGWLGMGAKALLASVIGGVIVYFIPKII